MHLSFFSVSLCPIELDEWRITVCTMVPYWRQLRGRFWLWSWSRLSCGGCVNSQRDFLVALVIYLCCGQSEALTITFTTDGSQCHHCTITSFTQENPNAITCNLAFELVVLDHCHWLILWSLPFSIMNVRINIVYFLTNYQISEHLRDQSMPWDMDTTRILTHGMNVK